MKALIIGSAKIENYSFIKHKINEFDIIICCDGGIKHTYNMEVNPNLIIGDFDSSDNNILDFYKEKDIEIQAFSTKKNYTDVELAVNYAIANSFKDLTLIGVTGDRLDHTLGNVFLLKNCLYKDVKAKIMDSNNTIFITKDEVTMSKDDLKIEDENKTKYVSIIPLSKTVKDVTTKGLLYELKNRKLTQGKTFSISNEFAQHKAKITIESGLILVIISVDSK